ncbi:UNVERIFIED_CONTAM: K(+)/H(+) antiporter [Siphonaria sp. JEL0065]|nr:K(+)/H(+) antiporter [Siphonaria sp. JEL0065]
MVDSGTVLGGANPMTISPIALFLIQTCLIIATSRLLTFPLKWLRQPAVIAELLGGLLLGASCLSKIPAFKENVFPKSSMPMIKLAAEIGLIFYLFLVGLELDPVELLKTFKKSVSISVAGIALPFVLGCSIANIIYTNYADQSVSYVSFLLFMGISMSITAFPVLARILTERKLLHTTVGQATISAAAVDDFIAWALLVLVIALINNSKGESNGAATYLTALYVCLCIIGYAIFLWVAIRPILRRLLALSVDREHVHQLLLFFVFLLVLFSSWFTEIIGVQAIFGAFLVGVIMPHEHGFALKLAHQIEDFVTIVFLPLFFAYSGLNTHLDYLDDAQSWGFVFLVCVVACAGKMIGCTLTARISGLNWRESSAVGILMNTRGLVQIIVLNVGLNAGVITDKIFAMFVLMAIFTTFLTVPLISVVYPYSYYSNIASKGIDDDDKEATAADLVPAESDTNLRTLVCLQSMTAVSPMMSLSSVLAGSQTLSSFTVYALRLVKMDDRLSTVMQFADRHNRFDPILNIFHTFAKLSGFTSHSVLRFSETPDIANNIVIAAKDTFANLIVIPQVAAKDSGDAAGEDLTESTKRLAHNVATSLPSVAVVRFIDRGFLTSSEPGTSGTQTFSVPNTTEDSLKFQPVSTATTVSVVLIVTGADSAENDAVRFVRHFSSSELESISMSIHVLRLQTLENSGSKSIVSELSFKSSATKVDVTNATEEIIDATNFNAILNRIEVLATSRHDLVVVGESLLNEIGDNWKVSEGSRKQTDMESWLEYQSAASVAIVHGRK